MAASSGIQDPFQAFREWLDGAERQMNKTLNDVMESERFGKAQSKAMEAMLGLQSQLNEASHRYFTTINLPTRTDFLALLDKVESVERRLARIEEAIGTVSAAPRPSARPKRTKKAAKKTAKKKSTKKKAAKKKTGKKTPRRR